MAALRSLTEDERDETQADLDRTRADLAGYRSKVARLRAAGEPSDSPWLRKLGWQIDACTRWISWFKTRLEEVPE